MLETLCEECKHIAGECKVFVIIDPFQHKGFKIRNSVGILSVLDLWLRSVKGW